MYCYLPLVRTLYAKQYDYTNISGIQQRLQLLRCFRKMYQSIIRSRYLMLHMYMETTPLHHLRYLTHVHNIPYAVLKLGYCVSWYTTFQHAFLMSAMVVPSLFEVTTALQTTAYTSPLQTGPCQ